MSVSRLQAQSWFQVEGPLPEYTFTVFWKSKWPTNFHGDRWHIHDGKLYILKGDGVSRSCEIWATIELDDVAWIRRNW